MPRSVRRPPAGLARLWLVTAAAVIGAGLLGVAGALAAHGRLPGAERVRSAVASATGSSYEVVDAPPPAPRPAPGAADTLPTVVSASRRPAYPCARLLPGRQTAWRGDTLLVAQAEGYATPFCVPYNVPAATSGVEATARTYPPDPRADLPGYNGWRDVAATTP